VVADEFLEGLIADAIDAAKESDNAWLEFIEELTPEELEVLNENFDYVRNQLELQGVRIELRMP
jgi:hypothetical protein